VDTPLNQSELPLLSSAESICGIIVDSANSGIPCKLYSISYKSLNTLSSYPVVSPHTAVHCPSMLTQMSAECAQLRSWASLRLELHIPPVFMPIIDAEAVRSYEKMFTFLMKVTCFVIIH
jgi:hypothetical protein